MARPLFQLGSFQFDLPNGVPQTLERTADYRWEEQGRILRDPAAQFLGPGGQSITLDGVMLPGLTGKASTMETLRELAARGEPQMLSDGLGRVYGKWAITSLREGLAAFAPGGGARQINFTVQLLRYVEDDPGQAATPLALAFNTTMRLPGAASLPAFTSAGSAFDATSWSQALQFQPVAQKAQQAGFGLGQLATIARSVANQDYVGAALGAFGIDPLSTAQQSTWAGLGINAAQLVQQAAIGRSAPAMSVALQALRPATSAALSTLGGSPGGAQALADILGSAATISTMLDVDPFITGQVRALIQP